nr:MAG TPA: hypothetical protein [Caudoviricetes sp.]
MKPRFYSRTKQTRLMRVLLLSEHSVSRVTDGHRLRLSIRVIP